MEDPKNLPDTELSLELRRTREELWSAKTAHQRANEQKNKLDKRLDALIEESQRRERDKTFVCLGCRKEVSWDKGCDDDLPNFCDDCWAKAHEEEIPEPAVIWKRIAEARAERLESTQAWLRELYGDWQWLLQHFHRTQMSCHRDFAREDKEARIQQQAKRWL
jgi:hypothetical protein